MIKYGKKLKNLMTKWAEKNEIKPTNMNHLFLK